MDISVPIDQRFWNPPLNYNFFYRRQENFIDDRFGVGQPMTVSRVLCNGVITSTISRQEWFSIETNILKNGGWQTIKFEIFGPDGQQKVKL